MVLLSRKPFNRKNFILHFAILQQQPGPSRFSKEVCDYLISSFIFVHQNLLDMVCKWTNAEGR